MACVITVFTLSAETELLAATYGEFSAQLIGRDQVFITITNIYLNNNEIVLLYY